MVSGVMALQSDQRTGPGQSECWDMLRFGDRMKHNKTNHVRHIWDPWMMIYFWGNQRKHKETVGSGGCQWCRATIYIISSIQVSRQVAVQKPTTQDPTLAHPTAGNLQLLSSELASNVTNGIKLPRPMASNCQPSGAAVTNQFLMFEDRSWQICQGLKDSESCQEAWGTWRNWYIAKDLRC